MAVSPTTKILLAFRSGDMCAMPECDKKGKRLSVDSNSGDPVNVGEAAHIEGENPGTQKKPASARYNPEMEDPERNRFQNLIYLCRGCHKRIDTLPSGEEDYPVEKLQAIKMEHESKVRQAMLDAFASVGFTELQEATKWAQSVSPTVTSIDYSLLEIEEKIKKNDLASESKSVIAMGLGVAHEVEKYIESVAQQDEDFPERLTAGFLQEYYRLKQEGYSGDSLFELMCRFAQKGFERQIERSAGLAVLIHLFEACDIFEK